MATGFYVSVQHGQRRGLLLGPFDTHEDALERVEDGRQLAQQADDRAVWYAYGTAKVEAARLPEGKLNGLALTSTMVARLKAAGIDTRRQAEALTVDQRDQVLSVAAWSGIEDAAWARALEAVSA